MEGELLESSTRTQGRSRVYKKKGWEPHLSLWCLYWAHLGAAIVWSIGFTHVSKAQLEMSNFAMRRDYISIPTKETGTPQQNLFKGTRFMSWMFPLFLNKDTHRGATHCFLHISDISVPSFKPCCQPFFVIYVLSYAVKKGLSHRAAVMYMCFVVRLKSPQLVVGW